MAGVLTNSGYLSTSEPLESIACPLCGCDDATLIQRVDDRRHGLAHQLAIARCASCDMVYLRERVPGPQINEYYRPNYITNQTHPIEPAVSWKDRLFNASVWDREKKKLRAVEKYLRPGPGHRLLDVGTGPGFFPGLARQRWGCEVRGVDFSEQNAVYARERFGVQVDVAAFEDTDYAPASFDVLTMWHYLEHDYRPRATLRRAHELLRDNGLLVLEVPNIDSCEAHLFGRHWYNFDCPRHVLFFSPQTIRATLEASGFAVEAIDYPVQAVGWSGSLQHLTGIDLYDDLRKSIVPATIAYLGLLPLSLLGRLLFRNDWMTVIARKR